MAGPSSSVPNLRKLPLSVRDQTNLEEHPPFQLYNKPHQVSLANRPHHTHNVGQPCRTNSEAQHLLRKHKDNFPTYWDWSDRIERQGFGEGGDGCGGSGS